MKNQNVIRIMKALGLKRSIVGIRFISFQTEYEQLAVPEIKSKVSFCCMVQKAGAGDCIKAHGGLFNCKYGAYALGVIKPGKAANYGKSYSLCGLYESYAVAHQVVEEMDYLEHDIYGLEIAPLEKMSDADVVIIIGSAEQMMRVFQGYAYSHGMPQHVKFAGNQAMCSDLVSKPFFNNDINLSLFCRGARIYGKCEAGDVGVGLPISLFDNIVEGLVQTINPVVGNTEKRKIEQSLETNDQLGIEIIYDSNYPDKLAAYESYCEIQSKS